MTATLLPDAETWTIGAPRVLAGLDSQAAHLGAHGPLPAVGLDRLLAYCDAVQLAGRGGAGFPFATKVRALAPGRPAVVVNGAESEPASRKDRLLMRRAPHLVLDGAITVAAAVGAREIVVGTHDPIAVSALQQAIRERDDARSVRISATAGGFVAGEARALVRALDGGRPTPPGRRQHATSRGLHNSPTIASNVETFAQLAVLARLGPARFAETGLHAEPGTTLLTIGGAVGRPGVVEVPIGTPLAIVLDAAAARNPSAVLVGGYHGAWLPPQEGITLSRQGIRAAGGRFGAGVVLTLDQTTCELGEVVRVTRWLAAQSSQQCGPCRFGLPALADDVTALWHGEPTALGRAIGHAQVVTGRGACTHPDGAAGFVTSGLRAMGAEIEAHRRGGCGRPVRGLLPVPS